MRTCGHRTDEIFLFGAKVCFWEGIVLRMFKCTALCDYRLCIIYRWLPFMLRDYRIALSP